MQDRVAKKRHEETVLVLAASGRYTCEDRRSVTAVYRGTQTVLLTLDGHTDRLGRAMAADGARYTGDHWQWWVKGTHQAQPAPVAAGETIALARGVAREAH